MMAASWAETSASYTELLLPGSTSGYLECGESSAAGAARETLEEASAHVDIDAPFVTFDIPQISQVCIGRCEHSVPFLTFRCRGVRECRRRC